MQARVDAVLEQATQAKKVPGVAAVALNSSGDVLYKGLFGTTNLDDPDAPAVDSSTPTVIFSCTKIVTCIAALQLLEQGKLSLSDPVEKWLPRIKDIKVVEKINDDGSPVLRSPKKTMTVLNLMTHTAGFTYDFFDQSTLAYRVHHKQNVGVYMAQGTDDDFGTPLVFDPGEQYCYGINIDYLGFVIEAVSGQRLDEYIEAYILKPLNMSNTKARLGDAHKQHLCLHLRNPDGSLTANAELGPGNNPDHYGGGHYLLSTLDDYSSLLLALLNKGEDLKSGNRILKAETVEKYIFSDQLPTSASPDPIGEIPSTVPLLTNVGTMLPGVKKGWSCGLMLNHEDTPNGRKAGSGAWAGLGNLYWWIDPAAGKLGLLMSAVLPFFDKDVCYLFDELERAVYGKDAASEPGGKGSNFVMKT